MSINTGTAKTLGIAVPASILLRADNVVEKALGRLTTVACRQTSA